MYKGTTSNGFQWEISAEAIDNMELLDAIVEADDNPLMMSKVVRLLLGDAQRKKLYDHLRTEMGNVPVEAVSNVVTEIFNASGQQGKN